MAWLDELIFLFETRYIACSPASRSGASRGRPIALEATEVGGEPIDRDRHVLDHEVKAVTRHGLALDRDGAGWLAEMILDI